MIGHTTMKFQGWITHDLMKQLQHSSCSPMKHFKVVSGLVGNSIVSVCTVSEWV